MKRTIMTLSLLASLGLGATAQSGTIPQDVGVAQEQSGLPNDTYVVALKVNAVVNDTSKIVNQ